MQCIGLVAMYWFGSNVSARSLTKRRLSFFVSSLLSSWKLPVLTTNQKINK